MDQRGKVFVFTSAIFSHIRGTTHHNTTTHNHTPAAVSHLVETICIPATVDLCCLYNSQSTAERFIGLAVPIFQTGVFYRTFEI